MRVRLLIPLGLLDISIFGYKPRRVPLGQWFTVAWLLVAWTQMSFFSQLPNLLRQGGAWPRNIREGRRVVRSWWFSFPLSIHILSLPLFFFGLSWIGREREK